jgi:RHS repeat-associated protein
MVAGGQTYRLIKDHLGSVRLVVDQVTGAVAQELMYDTWGRVIVDTNPGFQPFGFAGGLYDPETRLVRFGARDYDAQFGRWSGADQPRVLELETNRYLYAIGDPLNNRDPMGEMIVSDCKKCQAAARNQYRNCVEGCSPFPAYESDCMLERENSLKKCEQNFPDCKAPPRDEPKYACGSKAGSE